MSKKLTIAELELMLKQRRQSVDKLLRARAAMQEKLDAIDTQIGQTSGSGHPQARNDMPLTGMMLAALKKGPLRVGVIAAKVLESGYRTKSANFRGIVNQTLIKDKRFVSTGRGVYQLAK